MPAKQHLSLSKGDRWMERFLLGTAFCILIAHWVHLAADPSPHLGLFHSMDRAGNLFTDEGWAGAGAMRAALSGSWYTPGDFNLAVDAPLWPFLLYFPFQWFGVTIVGARFLCSLFYAGTVLATDFLIRALARQSG